MKHPSLTPEQVKASLLGKVIQRAPVAHLSYSSRYSFDQCPKAFELGRMMGAPKKGAVWFLGGKAVHRLTEEWDRWALETDGGRLPGRPFDLPAAWDRIFREEMEQAMEADPAFGAWRKAGTRADNPEGESISVWYSTVGPAQVEAYIAWRRRTPQLQLWTTPDGQPAIELDVSCTLPGMEVELKAYIDRIFVNRITGQLAVVDLKTGSRKPDSPLQFGVYAAATKMRYDIEVPEGAAFMTRRGILTDPWDLAKYTPAYVGKHFAGLWRAIQAEHFAPKIGNHCGLCDVSSSCFAQDGPLAAQYDPDASEDAPF